MTGYMLPDYLLNAQHYINGTDAPSSGDATIQILDPATGQHLATTPAGTTADLDAAVEAAHQTFRSGVWSKLSGRERSRVLIRAAELIRERADEIAEVESRDVGKPISLAGAVDVNTAADTYEYAASLAQHLDGAVRRTPLPAHAYTQREPLGVVATITPFNFPLILSTSKIAVALAAGNTVVHKPAEDTPLTALLMARLLTEAGVPDGVYNVVTGYGGDLGDHLTGHPKVNKVAFTGSTQTGAHVAAVAGQALRPITAELGGNAANIVFADADLEKAVETVISAFVFNTGQFCMGGPRLLVERSVYEQVLEALAGALPHVPFGDPRDPATVIGPLATRQQYDKVVQAVEQARDAGARVVTGGEPADLNGGYFYRPTILADVDNSADVVQQEVFGPVLTVQAFDSEQEAIELANSTDYGLASGVQTSNISRAHRVSDALEAGIVWVNGWGLLDPSMPFGGVKSSGWGRENGPEQLDAYTRTKSVIMALDPAPTNS
ncbi:aldehyde dehydrogenase family protein [Citricoccus sp. GCM10030269]|uniref:aldehyde dehydrogenase family protein n=1 Tax=Citricoccus sp. GCM10030269 TaxID=3273388 RepID=UPI00360930A3